VGWIEWFDSRPSHLRTRFRRRRPKLGRYAAFVCYAREDKDFAAARLRVALMERGQAVWIDVQDIVAAPHGAIA
jgi:hypothetical protein